MILELIGYGLVRDSLLLLRITAVGVLLYLTIITARKIKETELISATTGFPIFLFAFAIHQLFFRISIFYSTGPLSGATLAASILGTTPFVIDLVVSIIFYLGMVIPIPLTELDIKLHSPANKSTKFPYPLTLIVILGTIILTPIVVILIIQTKLLVPISMYFIFIIFPFLIISVKYLNSFKNLEIVKKKKPTPLFLTGFIIAGLSNFLNAPIMYESIGYFVPILSDILVMSGGIIASIGWNRLPSLSELEWMEKMERLLIIHSATSLLLFEYDFQEADAQNTENIVDWAHSGSAIGGIDMLLGEILATEKESKGHIKEIEHENKSIFFNQGIATIAVLISSGKSEEFKFRLELFHLYFEKRFGGEELRSWDGELDKFKEADELIQQYFK
ncbi:MAG: membrane protein of unknown function [Promethearchaeota archaeon]|nr:MAG: membrane protein of unknown function [Candidatus Lokiarchaeota archaeon]